MKKRILLVNQASYLKTGLSIYGYNLLSRLQKNKNLHIAEFGYDGHVNHQDDSIITWKFYANCVNSEDERHKIYTSDNLNKYGMWRFEEVLLDFKPHIVISINDPWAYSFIQRSLLRDKFKLILMPTVDSLPYKPLWINHLLLAEYVVTYSDWSYQELQKLLGTNINLCGSMYGGVDFNIFKPVENKALHKQSFNLNEDITILGFVARNQPRKLFPDLLYVLKEINEKRNNVFLLLRAASATPHGRGWDIPAIARSMGILNRILFTYYCPSCSNIIIDLYKGEDIYCNSCNKKSLSTKHSVPDDRLAQIYNLMDLYIQYAAAGGFEIPIIEAAACGVPVFTINATAMSDFPNTIGAIAIEPFKMTTEISTFAERAVSDNHLTAKIILKYLKSHTNNSINTEIIQKTKEYYHWDKIVKKWNNLLESIKIDDTAWNHIKKPLVTKM